MKKEEQPLPAKEKQGFDFNPPEKQEVRKKEQPFPAKKKESVSFSYPEKQDVKKKELPLPTKEKEEVDSNHPEKQEVKKEQPPPAKEKQGVSFNPPDKQETKKKERPLPPKKKEEVDFNHPEKQEVKKDQPLPPKKVQRVNFIPPEKQEENKKEQPLPAEGEQRVNLNHPEKQEIKKEQPLPAKEDKSRVVAGNTQSPEKVSLPVEAEDNASPETDTSTSGENTPQTLTEEIQSPEILSPPVETEDAALPETDTPAPEAEVEKPIEIVREDKTLPEADTSTLKAEVEKSIETVLENNSHKPAQKIPRPKPELKKTGAKGPLAGIRLLDLTRLYPGPLATMMMAELGAEVIKIEDRISTDDMRNYPPYIGEESAGYLAVNRSKRSLALKFNEERGQEVFFQLVKTADLVIEQFRPGVLDRVGMGYYEAIKANPRIIYVSLTGYGQYGPYAKRAGHDINYMGYAGIISTTGAEKAGLVLPGVQIADIAGGAYMAVIAALSALWARERTGAGQRVDVSMLDSVLPLMSLQMSHYWAMDKELPPWQLPLSGGMPFYGIYKCADGKYIALGAIEPKFWKQFCELVDKPEWVSRYYAQEEDAEKLKIELTRMFRSRPRDAWIELVGKADLCLSPVLDISEVENDPHLQARGMIVEYDHPQHGRIKGIGMPLKFSRQEKQAPTPPPALGEHTLEILYELGYEDKDIRDMLRKGAVYIHKKK